MIRERLTYANVMVTLLAFVVLTGGAAYAATQLGKNSVGTKQLKKSSVNGAKIKNGAVTGVKVADHSLTGDDIDLSKLGVVPQAAQAAEAGHAGDATTLGGVPGSGFVSGGGSTGFQRLVLDPKAPPAPHVTLVSAPGVGSIEIACNGGEGRTEIFFAKAPAAAAVDLVHMRIVAAEYTLGTEHVAGAAPFEITAVTETITPGRYEIQASVPGGPGAVFTVSLANDDPDIAPGKCFALGQFQVSG
jgi:hypothetical protein